MVDRLVLVNGLPGSGKTTLASQLAAHLSVPWVSKDSVKELLADAFPAAAVSSLGPIPRRRHGVWWPKCPAR
jgi:predicted kinase